jgi:hypothetical protein
LKSRLAWSPSGEVVLWPSGKGHVVMVDPDDDFVIDENRETKQVHWILELLLEYGSLTSGEISELKGIDPQYASHQCSLLYRAGKVDRVMVPKSRLFLYKVKT